MKGSYQRLSTQCKTKNYHLLEVSTKESVKTNVEYAKVLEKKHMVFVYLWFCLTVVTVFLLAIACKIVLNKEPGVLGCNSQLPIYILRNLMDQ